MDWSQVLYLAVLATALAVGRPTATLAAVMLADLVATMALAESPELVAQADIFAAVLLIGGTRREQIVSALFVSMVFFEVIASRLNVPNALIYTATDVLAFVQCGVVGGADRGMGRLYRSIRGRSAGSIHPAATGRHPGIGLARNSEKMGG